MDNGASAADTAQPELPGGRRDTGGSRESHSFLTPNPSPVSKSFFTPASNRLSHLPTPQSPNDLNFDFELARDSPLRHGARATSTQTHPSTPRERDTPVIDSFPTPESSPLYARRPKSSQNTTTPSPPRTPRRGKFQPEAEITPLAISSRTPPVHRREVSPPLRSTLSSPFVDRSEQHTPSHTRSQSHLSSPDSSPMLVDDVFSPGPSAASTSKSTPLKAPVPTRPAGSEMSRIRLQLAAEKAAHRDWSEARRPDYLKRTKRPSADLEDGYDTDDALALDGKSTANMGVLESPVKGRRIGLFQETSEESFEESLLASGYTPYGDRPAYTEAQTPPTAAIGKARATLSQPAMEWLQQETPAQKSSPRRTNGPSRERTPSEKEVKKRRRLAAFNNFHSTLPKGSLVVVEVEGHGRVLMQKHPGERPPSPTESPTLKKRGAAAASGGRKKKSARATPNIPAKKVGKLLSVDESLPRSEEISKPNWLDTEFPWSMRAQERRERDQREHEEKMKCIARFLDRASDEESDDEDQSLGLTIHEEDDGPTPLRTGRGKMVPLKANPDAHSRDPQERVMLPSDPADARAALLSKRSVRALAFRRRRREADSEIQIGEDEEVCVCKGRDDGRELVQCDDCHTWYHLECIGIRSIQELGREEDPWYCEDCLGAEILAYEPASEPTFVPTDKPLSRNHRDPLMSSSSSALSPFPSWSMDAPIPRTPVHVRDVRSTFSSSSWAGSSSPSRGGPSTPGSSHTIRAYRTPTIFDPSDETSYALSTPSRLPQHGDGLFSTPKMSSASLWSNRSIGPFQTPSRTRRGSRSSGGALPFAFDDSAGRTTSILAYPYDDTPIRRARPRDAEDFINSTQSVLESPSAPPASKGRAPSSPSRGRHPYHHPSLTAPESPTPGRPSTRKVRVGKAAAPLSP
ncbi:hypothetical protein BXZ70DRAFT_104272 [Cristinia sonorae]|uniref:PHD-type domain-containing protein n=1 Tax=Cristinia sonorae TaxID=1940300 RepID=A0A8K0UR93_9AGAR|nr:hypothetical protein BXZ70DRAFT_104272 [Cristinia sonorae]